ncbi:hypothetical protein QUA20_06250 [Microcoleus sp. Pol7_A1]|uniref:hypothetical protein n=1 Tax=Microcoleus sp. Pol7_A1 TaxID=2818893 RepID=UPI002FCE74D3
MAAFTVTKSPGFCMAGDRLFLDEGRRKREEGRREREEGRGKKEEGRGKKEEGRRKKERRHRQDGSHNLQLSWCAFNFHNPVY